MSKWTVTYRNDRSIEIEAERIEVNDDVYVAIGYEGASAFFQKHEVRQIVKNTEALTLAKEGEAIGQTDGREGKAGEEGIGVEYIFAALRKPEDFQVQHMPHNDWPFEEPRSAGGLHWHETPPTPTNELPYIVKAARHFRGSPIRGSYPVDLNKDPETLEFMSSIFYASGWAVDFS